MVVVPDIPQYQRLFWRLLEAFITLYVEMQISM